MKLNLLHKAIQAASLQIGFSQILSALLLMAFIISGCGKEDEPAPIDEDPVPVIQDVYIGGSTDSGTGTWGAAYWKNSELVVLENAQVPSFITKVVVNENNVYAVGYFGNYAAYWKDGDRVMLESNGAITTNASDIEVVDGKVYVVGRAMINGKWKPVYWIDGEMFTCNAENESSSYTFIVQGSDVYIVGSYFGETDYHAGYWKNGIWNEIGKTGSYGYDIAISSKGIVISGEYFNPETAKYQAAYWENGVLTLLSYTTSFAWGLTTYNDEIYVAGGVKNLETGKFEAVYWRNGEIRKLSSLNVNKDSYGYYVKVDSKGDVFVIGEYFGDDWYSLHWKNNKLHAPFEDDKSGWYGWGLSIY
jgi:hypothetical protein